MSDELGKMLADTAKVVHEKACVIDAHADIEVPGKESAYVGKDGQSKVAPYKMAAGGVDAVVMAVAVGPQPRDDAGYAKSRRIADRKLAAVNDLVANEDNQLVLARTADEVLSAKAEGRRSIILGFQNTNIVGRDVDQLAEFYTSGCRIFALNHIGHNDCADSSRPDYNAELRQREADEEHGGLSDLGKQAIQRIEGLGGLLDVSQLSKKATLQALECATGPVIASHSNVRALCDVSRNLSDEEVDGIAAGGGVVHVTPFRGYLFDTTNDHLVAAIREARLEVGLPEEYLYPFDLYWEIEDQEVSRSFRKTVSDLLGPGTMSSLIDHIDYIVNRVGVDHVGIGTDFNHGGGMKPYNEAHDAPNVTEALLQRGYSSSDVEKIWGANFLRALNQVQA